jgi:DNA-binding transcriptional ArsR family regulator
MIEVWNAEPDAERVTAQLERLGWMDAEPNPMSVAALIGDPARATILMALLGGESRPATELALRCRLTPQTVSAHLAKLVEGGLLAVERSGRHRYYRLAGPQVAHALEALNALAPARPVRSLRQSEDAAALRFARTCYDHLAGVLGIAVTQALLDRGYILMTASDSGGGFTLTPPGADWLARFGIDATQLRHSRRAFASRCLDWSERRHHVAGALGAALAARLLELEWITRSRSSRAILLTPTGRDGLYAELQVRLFAE